MQDYAVILVVFITYIGIMLLIGLAGFLRTKNLTDYLLGGRKMGAFVSALSACASDMSGWLLMGLPGAVFVGGLTSGWIGIGLLAGSYLNWLFVAKRLRIESERLNALTISEYLENKFTDHSRSLRLITGVVILVFFMIYTVSGLVASGKLFSNVFGVNYIIAVVFGALAVIVYTSIGGFIAVCWTDAIQGMLMLGALIAVPVLSIVKLGGLTQTVAAIDRWSPHALGLFTHQDGSHLSAISLISTLGWGLGYFGMPHILTRFMAIESEHKVAGARRISVAWTACSLAMSILVGLVGIAIFRDRPLGDGETVFIELIRLFFHPVTAGICLAAILAAIMSTADSQLLVCTSVITEDFYKTFYKRDASEAELVAVGRIFVVIIAIIATLIALDRDSKVMGLVAYAWAGFGAAFGPVIVASLYWKSMTSRGAIAGIISGGLTVLIWKHLNGGLFDLYEIIPGCIISTACIFLFGRKKKIPANDLSGT